MSIPAPLLLDTWAAIWISHDLPIDRQATAAIELAYQAEHPSFVSPITAWEAGIMTSRGRAVLASRPAQWFSNLMSSPGLVLAEMPPSVLIEASLLPGTPPNDPADRIIIATAREYGYRIVTRDRMILDYAERGLVMALPC